MTGASSRIRCYRLAVREWSDGFFTSPASARPLAAFRIGLSAVLLLQAVALAPALAELYGDRGYVQWPIIRELAPAGVPRLNWVTDEFALLGADPDQCVRGVFLIYVAALGCLLIGWHTRAAAAAAWLGHLALCVSGSAGVYGVDTFARIALFYCVVLPVGHTVSLDWKAGRVPAGPTAAARLGLRVLQIHLCIAYLAAGLTKAAGEQWWTGEAVWLALNQPTLARFDPGWLAAVPWVAQVACWGTIAVEAGYPFFVWLRWGRVPWVGLTISLHVGIAVFLSLAAFSAVMIVLNVAAFLVSPAADPPRPACEGGDSRALVLTTRGPS
jgi:hypothetical protein